MILDYQIISSVPQFLWWVDDVYRMEDGKIEDKYLFFRGQCSAHYHLLPGVLRSRHFNEKDLFLDFKNTLNTRMDYILDTENILVEMQHRGIPTRMLDWTTKPLIALFMAVDPAGPASDAANIYALNPWAVYRLMLKEFRDNLLETSHPQFMEIMKWGRMLLAQGWECADVVNYLQNRFGPGLTLATSEFRAPLPFVARRMDPRVAPQGGCFVIWGSDDTRDSPNGDHGSALDTFRPYQQTLYKVCVPTSAKASIRKELLKLGITPFAVYPDTEGMKLNIKETGGLFRF